MKTRGALLRLGVFSLLTAVPVLATERVSDASPESAVAISLPSDGLSVLFRSARPLPDTAPGAGLRARAVAFFRNAPARFEFLPASSAESVAAMLDALPVVGSLHRRAGRRFNTDDASIDDFAICYRFTTRLGFQFVPGDPAPVKLAVSSMKNNTGVTVGLTWKVFRR